MYACRTHVVPAHQYMYTFPVWCTTDSRFRPKANLPRSGKYRSLCCVMMRPRTTVCYCTPHASHRVEQTPCHALALSSPHHPSLHIQSIHLSASSQPQVFHPRLAQVLTPTHLAAEPIVLPHLPTHVLANATLDFPSSRCQKRVVEDVEMKHFFSVRACEFVGGVVLTRKRTSSPPNLIVSPATLRSECPVCATCRPGRMIGCHARRKRRLADLQTHGGALAD
jgi:hypothetical protein